MTSKLPGPIEWLCKNDLLLPLAEQYVRECMGEEGARPSGKKRDATGRFPNLAGFCRTLCTGLFWIEALRCEYPEQYGALCALFEDEALNSSQSATVISAYMKEHLGFGEGKKESEGACVSGDIKLIFEHDIYEDGR